MAGIDGNNHHSEEPPSRHFDMTGTAVTAGRNGKARFHRRDGRLNIVFDGGMGLKIYIYIRDGTGR